MLTVSTTISIRTIVKAVGPERTASVSPSIVITTISPVHVAVELGGGFLLRRLGGGRRRRLGQDKGPSGRDRHEKDQPSQGKFHHDRLVVVVVA